MARSHCGNCTYFYRRRKGYVLTCVCLSVHRGGYPSQVQWGVPPSSLGQGEVPHPTEGVLDTPWSVCLLRSRRRIFLFHINSEMVVVNAFTSQPQRQRKIVTFATVRKYRHHHSLNETYNTEEVGWGEIQ